MFSGKAPYKYLTSPGDPALGMNLHWFDLSFQGDCAHLEKPFLHDHNTGLVSHVRAAILFGMTLVALFGFLDAIVLEDAVATVMFIRYGVIIPGTLLTLAITFKDWFPRHAQLVMAACVTFTGLGLSAILVAAPETTNNMYFAGNMLVIFFAYAFLRLRFVWATAAAWLIVISYPVMDLYFRQTTFELLFTNVFFTASASILGMFVAYSAEFHARRNYFLRIELQQQRSEVEAARDELEVRVVERTREAMAAAQSKSDFLANMSHEIRTPMNGVLGMLDLLRNSPLDQTQKDQLNTAFNSAEGLLDIINDVLDLSKIEAGKMTLAQEPGAPGEVIEEVCSLLWLQANSKNLQLTALLQPQVFDSYLIDSTRIRQIVLNLVGNAIKFTDQGSVTVSGEMANNRLRIQVIDTGIGILEEHQNSLFDAFNQAENSSDRRFGGTGLGLTITKQLIELMGGTISVSSEAGVGSEFTIDIPLASAPQAGDSNSEQKDASYNKIFLHVTDEMLRKSLDLLLQRLDCELVGLDLAEVVLTDDPDAEFQDVLLIRIDGDRESSEQVAGIRHLSQPIKLSALADSLKEKHRAVSGPAYAEEYGRHFMGTNILLVEDNAVNQKVARAMLTRLGVTTDVVAGGSEALQELRDKTYDLILMDCQMPGMDGFQTTEAIRREEQNSNTEPSVIVALTANAMEGDRKRCLDSGMNDYLAKPVNLGGLEQVLQRWVGQGKPG